MSTFKNIVNDFKTINMMLMKHGDLQSNCNNIEYNKNLKKLMIIDVDSITPMFHWERIEISTRNCIEDYIINDLYGLLSCISKLKNVLNENLIEDCKQLIEKKIYELYPFIIENNIPVYIEEYNEDTRKLEYTLFTDLEIIILK